MADTPEVEDLVIYRGRYRQVVGFERDGEIVVYQNPETERNTYSRTKDMEFSGHYGAWYPVGLLLSRAECVVYAALPGTVGGDVPQATAHEKAARMLDEEELKLGSLSSDDRERLDAKLAGYWPDEENRPEAADVFAEARELRAHREEVQNG